MSSQWNHREQIYRAGTEHLLAQVQRTPVEQYPFPHLVIRDFFPASLYAAMLERLPERAVYTKFDSRKHSDYAGQSNRDRFQLRDADLERLQPQHRPFWLGIRDVLGSAELKQLVFNKFADALAFRFGISPREAAALEGYPLPELFRETAGYRIAPHPDTRKKLVTMQISLPRDATQADLGTVFYRRSAKPWAYLRQPRGFEAVKQMPFLPNSAYAFCVLNTISKKSWHGRETLRPDCGERNTILNIYYAKAEHANLDIVRDHYQRTSTSAAA